MKTPCKYLILFVPVLLLTFSCSNSDIPEILEDDTPSLVIKGASQFRFDAQSCQESFSVSRKEFRVGDDKMSDYFILTLDNLPLTEGMKVSGRLMWTTDDDIRTLSNQKFSVLKVDDKQTVWLKCEAERIYVVARMVN